MPDFGSTPLSTRALGTNQFPVSAAFVPGSSTTGDLTGIEGIAINTDANGFKTTAIRMGLKDGDDATQGLTTDAAVTGDTAGTQAAKLRGINKILADVWSSSNHYLSVNIAAGSVTANIGTTNGLALDATVGKLNVAQGTALGSNTGPMAQGSVTTNAPSYTTGNINPLSLDTSGLLRISLKDTPSNTNNFNVNLAASAATVTVTAANLQTNVAQIGGTNVVTGGASGLLAVAGPVASGASNADNPIKIGAVFNTTQPTVANGQVVDAQATARGAQIVAPGVDNFATQIQVVAGTALAADQTNSELRVSTYVKKTTAGDTALTLGSATSANSVPVVIASDQGAVTITASNLQTNVAQFGGVNISTGTGASGTGIPRVTVSNDSQIQVWDGTNGPVAAKAARTSPTLADISHVHSISPNNTGLPVNLESIVQKTSNVSSGSVASLAKAFTSNNTAGNSIVVVCAVGNGTAPTISDTAGNTYTQVSQIANGTALNVAIFLSVGPASGGGIVAGSNTITVNNGGSVASIAMEIYEVSGLITQVPAQPSQTASNTGSSGTASTSNVSAASPNEYAFAGVGIGTAAQTITAGSGWTNDSGQQNPTTPAGLFSFVSMSQFLGSIKGVTPQATFTSEPWAIAVATFRPVVLGIEGTVNMGQSSTGTPHSSVASSASDVQLLAANTNRKAAYVYNDSTAILYLAFGTTAASTTNYLTQIPAQGFYEMPVAPIYTGIVRGIWSAANGNARITELS